MQLSHLQKRILVWTCVWIVCLVVVFPVLTLNFGKTWGFLIAISIYWIGMCLATGWALFGQGHFSQFYRRPQKLDWLSLFLAGFPIVMVLFAAFLPGVANYTPTILLLALVFAIINGTLEEYFWRGGMLSVFSDHKGLAVLFAVGLFTSWHVALALAHGIEYQGGAVNLIGGAAFLGAIWTFLTLRSRSLMLSTISHISVNFLAFSGLIQTNYFS